ncbi:MAG TPA: hypothetical protein VFX25_14790 [Streptosporangiaceae bacterium]|nr:hypothetical protein [Streptosporangiaceae bacterium]
MARGDNYRSPATGRWSQVPTDNTALSADSKFDVMRELAVKTQPESYAYDLASRDASSAGLAYAAPAVRDDLAVTGSRLRARRPGMVHPSEVDHALWGKQGAVLRSAARNAGPMDPSGYLTGCTDESEQTT